jgi:hypothetical protein
MIIRKSQSKEGPQLDLTLSFTLEIVPSCPSYPVCPVLFVWSRSSIIVPASNPIRDSSPASARLGSSAVSHSMIFLARVRVCVRACACVYVRLCGTVRTVQVRMVGVSYQATSHDVSRATYIG